MNIESLVRFRPHTNYDVRNHINWKKYNVGNIETLISNQDMYFKYVKQYVRFTIEGHYNSTIIAYGYSGSGKTYTVNGILPFVINELFKSLVSNRSTTPSVDLGNISDPLRFIDAMQSRDPIEAPLRGETSINSLNYIESEFKGLGVSAVEVYLDKARDLIDDRDVDVLGNGDSTATVVYHTKLKSVHSCIDTLLQKRTQYSTSINNTSSRSHLVIRLVCDRASFYIVDLAGCERVCKSKVDGITLEESKTINKNISALHDVILAASLKQTFIPYRNSKITTLLKQSLGGDSKTFVFLCCSSRQEDLLETNQTLDFGSKCMSIENKPIVHIVILELRNEIKTLTDKMKDMAEYLELLNSKDKALKAMEVSDSLEDPKPLTCETTVQKLEIPIKNLVQREIQEYKPSMQPQKKKCFSCFGG
jgi:hypothetical protein